MKKIEITKNNQFVLIAVYGTLRLNCYNNYLLGDSEYLGTYNTDPNFTMYGKNAGFPIVSPNGDTSITYEVFRVTDNGILKDLHNLEGFTGIINHPNNWYNLVEINNADFGTCYMYVQDIDRGEKSVIETGDWLNQESEVEI